jgi:putative tricarboxylic transport membrane protein
VNLDRGVALCILVFSIVYAWLAFGYELLPFERHQAFKPNTMPIGLSMIGIVLSLAILLVPSRKDSTVVDESVVDLPQQKSGNQKFDRVRPVILVLLMLIYAMALRPLGFIGSTSLFLIVSSMVLGERKFHILVPVALGGAVFIWYLVQEVLGIFLNPWPIFFG